MTEKSTTDYVEAAGGKSKAQILTDVFSLATQFSTCVEAFNLICPSKDHNHAQKVALAKLGLQQGRLLIFGDAVGISAPPATIARHMIPSHPGITNPDPHLPVNFGLRDPRLDDELINAKIRRALHEIAGRPANMSREELMSVYGLKSPKSFYRPEYPALDTNRLEGFREKYALLKDLLTQTGTRASLKRNMSMTNTHWTVKDTTRFNEYVKVVRTEVDALIDLMGVKEQVDRGTRSDLKSMGWHPELTGPLVRQDWEKLCLIREACEVDYPEYIEVIEKALEYISEELKESSLAKHRAGLGLSETHTSAAGSRRKSDSDMRSAPAPAPVSTLAVPEQKSHIQLAAERVTSPGLGKDRRPGWLSGFNFKSWSKGGKHSEEKQRSRSVPDASALDPQRSLSTSEAANRTSEDSNTLRTIRSKSLSEIPNTPSSNLDSRMRKLSLEKSDVPPIQENVGEAKPFPERTTVQEVDKNGLMQVDTVSSEGEKDRLDNVTTVNSLIDRHDMYPAVGRIETKDIRDIAHAPGQ
ncbi:hypothetical protein BDW02DRAFT_565119 [Decorospora gaudefroyi]|uniref:Prion-inhibition and propagation HeLo domain-containing protein n=1 Tax=Decorospora gaudefroyi TaxID=184978 RepID=A0A6A5KME5_9PLEO|nr:hypothetical protein BDW02DRAFT_565119 [Decorospora gaudefroyi]